MKVGDLVGWWDHEDEEHGEQRLAGIILEVKKERQDWGENYWKFLILMNHNGQMSWEYGSDLKVIHEDR